MPANCRCGRHWTGLNQAHCAICHEHFGSVAHFDRHKPSYDGCLHPAAVTKRNGDPVLKPVSGPFGVTWVGSGEYGGPRNEADPAITIPAA